MTDLSVILSAEHYDDGDPFQAPRPSAMSQSPTEYHSDNHHNHHHHAHEHQSHHNKRSPEETIEDEEQGGAGSKKRARGRPRVEPKDDTAADRRRTQIRLAQRAYRNRKETAIQTLEKKVDNLQGANEEMSKAFMNLYDSAVAQGLLAAAPEFGRQLQATTEKFVVLARQSSEDRDADQARGHDHHESDGANGGSTGSGGSSGGGGAQGAAGRSTASPESTAWRASSGASRSSGQEPASTGSSVASPDAGFASAVAAPPPGDSYRDGTTTRRGPIVPISAPFGYRATGGYQPESRAALEIITLPTVGNASFPVGTSAPEQEEPSTPFANAGGGAADTPLPPPFPRLLSTSPLLTDAVPAVPASYSYLERTFGRRLQRAALEQGLVLMHMPSPPPHVYAAVFGFSLLFEPREAIVRRLTGLISRRAGRTLHNWRAPFFHLGGAGSFFGLVSHDTDASSSGGSDERPRDPVAARDGDAGGDGRDDGLDGRQPPLGNQGTEGPHKPMRGVSRSTGPLRREVQDVLDTRVDERMRLTVPGFEGDFFDPDEIEFFLRKKGVYIPPASDFVTVDVDVGDFLVDNPNNSAGAGYAAPPAPFVGTSDADFNAAATTSFDAPAYTAATGEGVDLSPLIDPALSDPFADLGAAASVPSLADTVDFNFTTLPDLDFFFGQQAAPSSRRTVTINVEIFVHELVMKSVCLGRCPGIRPKDVISAFWAAATDT